MRECYLVDCCDHLGFVITIPLSVACALLWRLVFVKVLRRDDRPEPWKLDGFTGIVTAIGCGAVATLVFSPSYPHGAVFSGFGGIPAVISLVEAGRARLGLN